MSEHDYMGAPAPVVDLVRPVLPRNQDGLTRALDILKMDARYNTRTMRHQYKPSGGEWTDSTDRLEASIRERIAAKFANDSKNSGPAVFRAGNVGAESQRRAV